LQTSNKQICGTDLRTNGEAFGTIITGFGYLLGTIYQTRTDITGVEDTSEYAAASMNMDN